MKKNGNIPIYLLIGEDILKIKDYLQSLVDKIKEANNNDVMFETYYADEASIGEMLNECNTFSMFNAVKVIKIYNFHILDKSELKQFENYIKSPVSSNVLILVANTPSTDFLKKKGKSFSDALSMLGKSNATIVKFDKKYERDIRNITITKLKEKGYKFNADVVEYIVINTNLREGDIDAIISRIEEIHPPPMDLTIAIVQECSHVQKQPTIFEFLNSVFDRDMEKALISFNQLLFHNENLISMLFWLRRNIVTMWKIKGLLRKGMSQRGMQSQFSQPAFILNTMIKQANLFTFTELEAMMYGIKQLDFYMKSEDVILHPIRFEQFIIKFTK